MEQTILDQLGIAPDAKNVYAFFWARTGSYEWWNTIIRVTGDVPFLKITEFNLADNDVRRICWSDVVELGPRIDVPRQ